MTGGTRAYIGALVGALAVLCIHPRSRPYIVTWKTMSPRLSQLGTLQSLPENMRKLPRPVTLDEAAFWLHACAQNELAGKKLSSDTCLTLAEIADKGEEAEPNNAFWTQMKSVFIKNALGPGFDGEKQAVGLWIKASKKSTWNDHLNERLYRLVDSLSSSTGVKEAWQWAVAYDRRSGAASQRLIRHSRHLVAIYPDSIDVRVACVKNGVLIRDGARSVAAATEGANMIDLAGAYRRPLGRGIGASRLAAESLTEFLAKIPADQDVEQAAIINAYQSNEAWNAFVPSNGTDGFTVAKSREAIVAAVAPTALVLASLFGFALWLVGQGLMRTKSDVKLFGPPWAAVLGLGVGAAILFGTSLQFPALFAFIAFSLLCFESERTRLGRPPRLGKVFLVTLGLIALTLAGSIVLFLILGSVPGQLLANAAALPTDSSVTSVPVNLCLLAMCVVVAGTAIWGIAERYQPRQVLYTALSSIGLQLGAGALSLAILITPVCVAWDKRLLDTFKMLVDNEPNYYVTRNSSH